MLGSNDGLCLLKSRGSSEAQCPSLVILKCSQHHRRGSSQSPIAKIFSLFINYQTESSHIRPPIEGLDNQDKGNTDSRPRLLLPSPDACPSNAPEIIVLRSHRDSEILPFSPQQRIRVASRQIVFILSSSHTLRKGDTIIKRQSR